MLGKLGITELKLDQAIDTSWPLVGNFISRGVDDLMRRVCLSDDYSMTGRGCGTSEFVCQKAVYDDTSADSALLALYLRF